MQTPAAEPHTFPIIDPDTGEVLANDDAERQELADRLAYDLVSYTLAQRSAAEAAREHERRLALLLHRGDAVALPGGWGVTIKPGTAPRRQVQGWKIEEHQETLEPLGLGFTETPVMQRSYPGVADLTNPAARAALARVGLSPEALIHTGAPMPDRVVVVEPEAVPT